ncbi:hypothetical protein ACFSC4_20905 [Deinococcus malanensis]|uniref:hypothetical protein n=1 Tax=Deinococcus malanensis TaxID=1706855 RepID=UPI0036273E46
MMKKTLCALIATLTLSAGMAQAGAVGLWGNSVRPPPPSTTSTPEPMTPSSTSRGHSLTCHENMPRYVHAFIRLPRLQERTQVIEC